MRKQKLVGLLVLVGLFSAQAQAETRRGKLWRISAGGPGRSHDRRHTFVDGPREANGFLQSNDGRFSGRGVALKSLVVGGALGGQWLLMRKNPDAAGYAAA